MAAGKPMSDKRLEEFAYLAQDGLICQADPTRARCAIRDLVREVRRLRVRLNELECAIDVAYGEGPGRPGPG